MESHVPVMLSEILDGLAVGPGKVFLDGTVGYGGHAWALLERSSPDGMLIGIDQDPDALEAAATRLAPFEKRIVLEHTRYDNFDEVLGRHKIEAVDGMLLDLGVSAVQLQNATRGFSFRFEGPLDMRMDPERSLTAATIVNKWSEQDLEKIFQTYGEERFSRRYARAIARQRKKQPFKTTRDLSTLLHQVTPGGRKRIDPATRVFQALRIAVNEELDVLDNFLGKFSRYLHPKGRVAILSYHSLEDRKVKHCFREGSRSGELKLLTRKPLTPSDEERTKNPKSRSAKLRIAEKTEAV